MVKKAVRQRKKQVREWQRRQGSRKLKPHELDIYHLLLLFVVWVKQGSEPTLATFTTWCWQELRFSYIFEARPPGLLKEAYAQFLYSLVLNCLAKGIPPSAAGHIAEALAAGPHAAAAAALSARPRQRAQPLPAAGQEPEQQQQQQQQQQQHLLQQPPGQLLVGGGGQAALQEGQGPVEALAGPQPLAAAAQAAPVQVAYYAAALPVMQQAAAEQQPAPPGGVLPGLPAEATAPGGTMDSVEHPAGQHNGLLAQSQGTQLIGSLQVPVLLAVPVPQQHEPQLMHQLPGEQQLSSGPASPISFPTELDLLESELVALPALSPGSPQVPVHEGNLPEAGHHVSTGHAAGQHPHMAELQLRASLPADLDELLLDSPIPRLQSTPVKPSNGSKLGDAVPAAQPPQPVHGGAVAPAKAGKRGGDDHEDWLEQFVSEAADVPYPASAAAAGAAQLSQQSAGAAAPPMPSLVAGQAGDVALPVPEPATAPAGIEPAPAVGTTLSKEFVEGLVESAGLALPAGAVLALYCLYCAQPGAPTVKVYLTPEHQEALLEVLPRLQQGGFLDSVAAARQLLRWQALVPGCTRAQAQLPSIVPGGGVRREEAAVVREVKYHLASTLRGLATKGLAQLCCDYEESLSTMWASLGDPSPPRNIADLGVLRLLHEFTEAKHAEAHAVLREGRRWQPVGQAAAGQPAAAAADTGAAGEGGGCGQEAPQGASKAGSSKRAKQNGRQPASATGAAARRARGAKHVDDDDEEEVAGDGATAQGEALEGLGLSLDDLGLLRVPGATRVVKRQLARKKERDRRTHKWRQHMGVASAPAALQPLEGCAQPEGEDDFDLDMPMLEGLEFGLASEAPPRAQQTLLGRPRPAAAAGRGAHEQGAGSSGHSQGPAPSSGTEATVDGGAPGGPRRPAARPSRAAIPPIPTPAAVAALGPPGKAKAGAKVADKGARGTGTGKAAGAAGKRATAAKASPAVKAAGGKKRTAAAATSGAKPKTQKRARFADDAAAHTANGRPKVATPAKGARAGPHSSSAAGNASGSASSHRPPAAAAAGTRAAEVPAGRAVAGLMDEAELASIDEQAQQAATLALQALAEDEDYDAQEPIEAQPATTWARTASGPLAPVPPAQPFTPSAAAGLLLGQPKPPTAPAEADAEQGGRGKAAQQVAFVGRQGSTRQRGHQALPAQPRKLAVKRRKGESPALERDAALGARQLRHKQAGAPPSLPSVQIQVGSKASTPALLPPLIASQAAAAPAPGADKNPLVPAGQPASGGMKGKANGAEAQDGNAMGPAAAAAATGAAATALAAEAAGSAPGELDPWVAKLAEIEAATAAAQAALDEDAEI